MPTLATFEGWYRVVGRSFWRITSFMLKYLLFISSTLCIIVNPQRQASPQNIERAPPDWSPARPPTYYVLNSFINPRYFCTRYFDDPRSHASRERLTDNPPNRYLLPLSPALQHLLVPSVPLSFFGFPNCCLNGLQGHLVRGHSDTLARTYSTLMSWRTRTSWRERSVTSSNGLFSIAHSLEIL